MSGEYVSRLKSRSGVLLSLASIAGDTGLALFLVEQAAQLYIKAVYYEFFGERVGGHGLRELLGILVERLREAGYGGQAEALKGFSLEHRRVLVLLEEAYTTYTTGRYDISVYDTKDMERAIRVVKELVEVLEEVVRSVKLG